MNTLKEAPNLYILIGKIITVTWQQMFVTFVLINPLLSLPEAARRNQAPESSSYNPNPSVTHLCGDPLQSLEP